MTPVFKPAITAHALERFRERIMPLSDQAIKDMLLTEEVCNALAIGAAKFVVGAVRIIAQQGAVVTVYPAEWPCDPEGISRALGRKLRSKCDRTGHRRQQAAHKAMIQRTRT